MPTRLERFKMLKPTQAEGGKNENVTSSVVLVRTHFYPVLMAGVVSGASNGSGKASAGEY
jgi:hypothetical protein